MVAGGRSPYLATMITLHIEHPISDFDTWTRAFARFADVRRESGVLSHRVQRPFDQPEYVVVDLDFAELDKAVAFRTFLETVVWAVPENAPALAGTPQTMLLRVEQLSGD
jgi:hypothetical protein